MRNVKSGIKRPTDDLRGNMSGMGDIILPVIFTIAIAPLAIWFVYSIPSPNAPVVPSSKIVGVTNTTKEVSGGFLGLGTQNVPAVALQFANGTSKMLTIQNHPWVAQVRVGDRIAEQPDGPFSPTLEGIVQPKK